MPVTVDIWDPSSEGAWIAKTLRQDAFEVRSIELADVPLTRAEVVLMAGDAPNALGALKLLRDDGLYGDALVVLLGVPSGMEHMGDGPGFGADLVLLRPIDLDSLADRIVALLDAQPAVTGIQAPIKERTLELPADLDPNDSQVLVRADYEEPVSVWRPREPTLELSESEDEVSKIKGRSRISEPAPTGSRISEPAPSTHSRGTESRRVEREGSRVSSFPGTGSRPGTGQEGSLDSPEREIPPDQRAELSPWLSDLLRRADRRVFPGRAPLSLHLPAADAPPEELIPPELLELASLGLDEPIVYDPIDAFTYVGGPAVPPPAPLPAEVDEEEEPVVTRPGRRLPSSEKEVPPDRPPHERSTATELPSVTFDPTAPRRSAWPEDDTVLGRPVAGRTRRGSLEPGGALRLLWRIAALGLDASCELRAEGMRGLELIFLAGELRAFEGPVALTVLEGLRRRGRATEAPAQEPSAEAILQRYIDAGRLGRFERDRLMREARERLLRDLIRSPSVDFELRSLDDTQPGRVLSRSRVLERPLRAALVTAAREALDVGRVRALLEPAGQAEPGLAFGPRREAALAPAELPFELVELIVRLEGRRLSDFLAAAPTETGLAGLLYALLSADALVVTEAPDPPSDDARRSVVALVEAAASRALDADYFAILGVAPDAGGPDVERAYRTRRAELEALPLETLGLGRLDGARREAIEALDEAHLALEDASRRVRYARAIGVLSA